MWTKKASYTIILICFVVSCIYIEYNNIYDHNVLSLIISLTALAGLCILIAIWTYNNDTTKRNNEINYQIYPNNV
jgi:hypothetical protein